MVRAVKRIGRPTKEPAAGTRQSLGLKVTPKTKALLDSATKLSGRTQSQEAEFRIENSFRDLNVLEAALELAFGQRTAGLLLLMGMAVRRGANAVAPNEYQANQDHWLDDPDVFLEVEKLLHCVLGYHAPEGEIIADDKLKNSITTAGVEESILDNIVASSGDRLSITLKRAFQTTVDASSFPNRKAP